MIDNPIFIIGTERSGSNLLRLILNTHPNISIPHPPHVMRDFHPFISSYGNLSEDKNLDHLLLDVEKFVNYHFSPWPFMVTKEELKKHMPSPSLYGVYVSLYEMYRLKENKIRWGCKSTFMHQHIPDILVNHQNPKFIHLVRDPRDVSVSATNSIFSKYHPLNVATLWKKEQENIERYAKLKDEGKLITIRYEDLTNDTEIVVKNIMSFLNEDFSPVQLSFYQTESAKELASLSSSWKQVEKPVSKKSVGQYKNKLKKEDIIWIEFLCSDLMKKYNYPLDNAEIKVSLNFLQKVKINFLEQFLFIKTELMAIKTDRNFKMRWRKKILLSFFKLKQQLSWR